MAISALPMGARHAAARERDLAASEHRETTELVLRARAGDRDAFAAIYGARVSPISRYVSAIVRDVDRSEDVVAEVFLAAFRELGKLRDPGRFDAWLFRIAHNKAVAEARKRRHEPLEAAERIRDARVEHSPSDMFDQKTTTEEVRDALIQLAAKQREVVVLRQLQELSYKEIARQTGNSEQGARALHHRGLKQLRKILNRRKGADPS